LLQTDDGDDGNVDHAAYLAATGLDRKAPRRNTIRLRLAAVKALLATPHEEGLIRSNPAAGVRILFPARSDAGGG
jgi:hypothetical protein